MTADTFLSRVHDAVAASLHGATVLVGDRLGLYQGMADCEPTTARELAERTGTSVDSVDAWLRSQAAAGYVEAHADDSYRLPPEHADALVHDRSAAVAAGFWLVAAAYKDEPLVTEAFRTGVAPGPAERHPDLRTALAWGGLASRDALDATLECLFIARGSTDRAEETADAATA